MSLKETLTLQIKSLDAQGLGIADTGIGPVPYCLPGEKVRVEHHTYRRQSTYVLKDILKASKARVIPPCPAFGACGGCLLQHMNHETQNGFKMHRLKETLAQANINITPHGLVSIMPGNRRRLRLEGLLKNGTVYLGLKRFGSDQIINLNACAAVLDSLSRLILPLHKVLETILVPGQKVDITLTQATNGIDGAISDLALDTDLPEVHDFMRRYNVVRFGPVVHDAPYVLMDGVKVMLAPGSFLQASLDAEHILQKLVLEAMAPLGTGRMVDLFAGLGTFALPLSKSFTVDAFEGYEPAIASLTAAAPFIQANSRDLFQNPLTTDELQVYQGAVINPPRAGAMAQIQVMAKSILSRVCYVSCNPETFARDAQVMMKGGYKLTQLQPVDQFPWTPHLEVVGFFER